MDAGTQTRPVSVFPRPNAPHFELCSDGMMSWRCPNCGGKGEHWYVGEVVPRECITNALPTDNCSRTLSSLVLSSGQHAWEVLGEVLVVEVLVVEHAVEVSAPVVEPLGERRKRRRREGRAWRRTRGRAPPSTSDLAPRQVPVLQQAMPVGPGFWLLGQGM